MADSEHPAELWAAVMRLTDLDPRWLIAEGRRVGFIFISPKQRVRSDGTVNPTPYRQTCFAEKTPFKDQCEMVWRAMADLASGDLKFGFWQSANPNFAWTIMGGIAVAKFETLTVLPSIDGSKGGFWHGYIKDGEIR